jgi:CBS domain-containing protein
MNLNIPISEIMTTNVLFVHYNNKLEEVERLMNSKKIKHLPVLKEGKLNGIVSLTDLQRLGFTKSITDSDEKSFMYETLNIEDVMMNNPVTISSKATLKEVAEILIKSDFHALPVVDNEVLLGIVTTTDLMAFILEEEDHLVH